MRQVLVNRMDDPIDLRLSYVTILETKGEHMLTRGQNKALDFIRNYMNDHQHAPTSQEIAAAMGIVSRGVVYRYLKALQAADYIQLIPGRHRNIRLKSRATIDGGLPLLGKIAAGEPIEAIEDHEMVDISRIFLGENRFALRVCGDSMIEEGIIDGDLVVCSHAREARQGQIVVALVDRSQATLKKITFPKHGMVRLVPANRDYLPQDYTADRVQVQGIYLGLLRIPS